MSDLKYILDDGDNNQPTSYSSHPAALSSSLEPLPPLPRQHTSQFVIRGAKHSTSAKDGTSPKGSRSSTETPLAGHNSNAKQSTGHGHHSSRHRHHDKAKESKHKHEHSRKDASQLKVASSSSLTKDKGKKASSTGGESSSSRTSKPSSSTHSDKHSKKLTHPTQSSSTVLRLDKNPIGHYDLEDAEVDESDEESEDDESSGYDYDEEDYPQYEASAKYEDHEAYADYATYEGYPQHQHPASTMNQHHSAAHDNRLAGSYNVLPPMAGGQHHSYHSNAMPIEAGYYGQASSSSSQAAPSYRASPGSVSDASYYGMDHQGMMNPEMGGMQYGHPGGYGRGQPAHTMPGTPTMPDGIPSPSYSGYSLGSMPPEMEGQMQKRLTPVTGRVSRAKKGIPVHECEMCKPPKIFTRAEHLRRHQLSHGEPTYYCEHCQRGFYREDLLRRHTSRHIKGKATSNKQSKPKKKLEADAGAQKNDLSRFSQTNTKVLYCYGYGHY